MAISAAYAQRLRNAGFTQSQIVILNAMQSDILPVGTTAGTVAAGDDARFSASTSPSWVFNVKDYGALGNGQAVGDGAIANGSSTLTCATSARFTAQDANKHISVREPGTGSLTILGTILTVHDEETVTISTTNTSGGDWTNCVVVWADDDTEAIQAAIDDATDFCRGMGTFAGPNFGGAEVFSPAGAYGIAGALKTGGDYLGNSQLCTLPIPDTENAVCLDFTGICDASATQSWNAKVPQFSGSTWLSFGLFANPTAQGNSEDANGTPSVLGGPTYTNGYGVSQKFSNMQVTVSKLSILCTYSHDGLSYGALNFFGIMKFGLRDMAWGTTGLPLNGEGDFQSGSPYGTGGSIGIVGPAPGNNDKCYFSNITCHGGFTYAMFFPEHTVADRICILYCWAALCIVGNYAGSVGATHAFYFGQASVEACVNLMLFVGQGSQGIGPFIHVGQLDTETSTPTFADFRSEGGIGTAVGDVTLTGLFNWDNLSAVGANFTINNGQVNA